MSDSGTCNKLTPFYAFLGSVVVVNFPLGNLRVPSPNYSGKNGDIQHPANLVLLRHIKSFNANSLVSEY